MSFNIFDSATKDSIRVGYIDPDRGYLTGQSIYEANVHASKNPGAVFILETRDRVRYLTICLLYTSPSPRDPKTSRMPSSA